MADDQETPDAVESAFSGMPGLRENTEQRPAPTAPPNAGEAEDQADSFAAPQKPQVEDSEAVNEALNQMPGLRDSIGG